MKSKKIKIQINKPVSEVFAFTINPKNTPKWTDSIIEEKTNEWPVKVGSIYKSRGDSCGWNEYVVAEFVENKIFALRKKDGDYHVRYTFTSVDKNKTDLEYFEWVETGELEEPFTIDILKKLKVVIERRSQKINNRN